MSKRKRAEAFIGKLVIDRRKHRGTKQPRFGVFEILGVEVIPEGKHPLDADSEKRLRSLGYSFPSREEMIIRRLCFRVRLLHYNYIKWNSALRTEEQYIAIPPRIRFKVVPDKAGYLAKHEAWLKRMQERYGRGAAPR